MEGGVSAEVPTTLAVDETQSSAPRAELAPALRWDPVARPTLVGVDNWPLSDFLAIFWRRQDPYMAL
jgi:hypothetical protein